jgi:FtsP/CotA-like multicopper oxidase with cupredoxin domain
MRDIAARNRRGIVDAKLSRRDMMKLGLLTAAGTLALKSGVSARANGGNDTPISPPTRPFVVELPIPPIAQPVNALFPNPQAGTVVGEAPRGDHQFFNQFPPKALYDIHEREGLHSFHPDLPRSTVWRFTSRNPNGSFSPNTFLGPAIHARYGDPVLARIFNDLPPMDQHVGFGVPQTSTHLHSGHIGSESDGYPTQFYGPGLFKDFHFPNFFAGAISGFDGRPGDGVGDPREALSTLWYHDHRVDFTAQNVYKGLAGAYLLFDDRDSGDENDPNPAAFRLPSGEFDVPLVFSDALFDADGQLFFDLFEFDGLLGDKFLVNGAIQPFLQVAPRKYRFRLLNGSLARYYEFFRSDGRPFIQIGSDAALLPAPITQQSIRLATSERADVIIDFSEVRKGESIFLQNRLVQNDGRGPTDDIVSPGTSILRFDVVKPLGREGDLSQVPFRLRDLPPIDLSRVKRTRMFEVKRDNGAWAINGEFFDDNVSAANPRRAVPEIWIIRNSSGGWSHPFHIHADEFRLLSRNGQPPRAHEVGRKDSFDVGRNDELRILVNFRDFLGKYVMHCHNILHEDHAMMARFDIVPGGQV